MQYYFYYPHNLDALTKIAHKKQDVDLSVIFLDKGSSFKIKIEIKKTRSHIYTPDNFAILFSRALIDLIHSNHEGKIYIYYVCLSNEKSKQTRSKLKIFHVSYIYISYIYILCIQIFVRIYIYIHLVNHINCRKTYFAILISRALILSISVRPCRMKKKRFMLYICYIRLSNERSEQIHLIEAARDLRTIQAPNIYANCMQFCSLIMYGGFK